MKTTLALALLSFTTAFSAAAYGSVPLRINLPELGRIDDEDGSGSYIDIQEKVDGYTVEIFLEAGDRKSPFFTTRWDVDGWTEIEFQRVEIESFTETSPFYTDYFDPFNNPGSESITPKTVQLQPGPDIDYGFSFSIEGRCQIIENDPCDQSGRYLIEYSVNEMAAPLIGDFNYDNKVNFSDFLILADGVKDNIPGPAKWRNGDIDFNEKVDFEDFLAFRDNYGAERTAGTVASIPEPSGLSLALTLSLLCVGSLRRQQIRIRKTQ